MSDIGALKSIYEDFLKGEAKFNGIISKIRESGDGYLIEHYREFVEAYDAEYVPALTFDGVLVYGPEIVDGLKRKYPENDREIDTLIAPYGETFLGRYRRRLVSLAAENPKGPGLDERLEGIASEFHWMHNNYRDVGPIPLSFFEKEYAEQRSNGDARIAEERIALEKHVEEHQNEVEAIRKRRVFSDDDFDQLFWIGFIAWWSDRRKEYNLIANHYIGRYLEHLCAKYGLRYDDAKFLYPWELDSVIEGKSKLSDYSIEERKNGGFHFMDCDGDEFFFVGKEADSIWEMIEKSIHGTASEAIKGSVACKGRVVGIARIVKNPKEAKSFMEGDILVAGNTRPEYLPLMKKAAAFVTEEGGVTSHAAIVARELNKPCIVGTKIATKALRDGMLIEVDADNGEVRILKD
ncbi:MAG: hypothetical protein KGH98_04335 [Candidatus Micrarchaeota archaeon]|nr:hypothetical protein [Candidatus Micrarchaeota archaeon]